MRLLRFKRSQEEWDELRARMLAETELFITECLRHPELAVRIPVIQSGRGKFPPSMAEAFWEPVLND
ncbi:hypothetical protein RAS1_31570 [Phycisphaerae bacterium RAS1]|nr:hypothetical protein RAS1_31570 [Phycisphaerae bacterium RAS1]